MTKERTDSDATLLAAVVGMNDFLQSFIDDSLEDWQLVKQLGELLIRIDPGEILGHALLLRALRHLGDSALAAEKLLECRELLVQSNMPAKVDLFQSFLEDEEEYLKR